MSEYRSFLVQKSLVFAANLLVIIALFIAMYRASLFPDDFTPTFFMTFFSLFVPIFILGYMGRRFLLQRQKMPI
jgi:hypothetical protein